MQIKFFDGMVKLFDGTTDVVPRKGEIVTFKAYRYRVQEVAQVFARGESLDGDTSIVAAQTEITLERLED